MNRINPLHIGILLLVLVLFLLFKLDSAKNELAELKEQYNKTSKLAIHLSGLKDVYANKKKSQAALRRVLSHSALRSAEIIQIPKKSSLVLSSVSMDKKSLDTLMGKLLNSSYDITSMKIKRLSEKKASMKMEIKW